MNVLQLRQKNFPTYPKYTLRCIFPAELIGTLSFAVRARFSSVKLTFSVLNAKKLKKFSRFKPIKMPIKINTFQKICGHTFFFLTLKNIQSFEKSGLYVCAPNFEN